MRLRKPLVVFAVVPAEMMPSEMMPTKMVPIEMMPSSIITVAVGGINRRSICVAIVSIRVTEVMTIRVSSVMMSIPAHMNWLYLFFCQHLLG